MLTALPLPQTSAAPHQEVSPEPTVPLEGKGSPGVTSTPTPQKHCGSFNGNPYSGFAPQGLQRNWTQLQGI